MQLESIISNVKSLVGGISDEQVIQAISDSGVEPECFTDAHVNALAKRFNGSAIATTEQGPTLSKRPQRNAGLSKPEAPRFDRKAQAEVNIGVVHESAKEQGRSDAAMIIGARNEGYASGVLEQFQEGEEQFSTFRQDVLSQLQAAIIAD